MNPEKSKTIDQPTPKLDIGKTIAVKHLAFHVPHPKLDAVSSISACIQPGVPRVTIDFAPQLRHHRLEIHKPNSEPRVLFIHETHVASWEPAA